MMKARLEVTAAIVVLALGCAVTAQTNAFIGPQLINSPAVLVPDEAEFSGLGGLVRVRVSVDEDGNATSIEQVTGPDWTCPQVSDPDVTAMREAAAQAAMSGKFAPATLGGSRRKSSITLNFDFPSDHSTADSTVAGPVISVKRNDKYVSGNIRVRQRSPRQISGGVVNGKAVNLVNPVWPAVGFGTTGSVNVLVMIDTDGDVFSAKTVSGHPLFRFSAVSAACQSKFNPTRIGGEGVRVAGVITYKFNK